MCGVKTENMAVNVCHAEGDFWRAQAKAHGRKSRGEFQKMVLLLGLAELDPKAAKMLRAIRAHYRQFGAALLLALYLTTLKDHDATMRAGRSVRVTNRRDTNSTN